MNLPKLKYDEIHDHLKDKPSDELLALLDDRSVKIGDTAAGLLARRGEWRLIAEAILNDRFQTRNGKVRAANTLCLKGRSLSYAINAYLHLMHDRHPDVVGCALFGVVFWNDPQYIDDVRTITNPRALTLRDNAIRALEGNNPAIYSPYFFDQAGVWTSAAGPNSS